MQDWDVNNGDYVRDRDNTNRVQRKKRLHRIFRNTIIFILLFVLLLFALYKFIPGGTTSI